MKTYDKFKEYIWLVNTIRRSGRISFADINQKWLESELSEGVALSRSTFNRHKIAIEEMFGIIIDCDVKDYFRYYIANPEVLREDSVQNWMLSTLSVNNVVSESLSLQDRILMESAPVEGDLLKNVIEAMHKNVKVEIKHRRYGSDTIREFTIAPYCLKLFKHRWYVLGQLHREATEEHPAQDRLILFSFDRILSLRITDEKFTIDPDFNAEEFFSDSYGVLVNTDERPQRIVLRAYGVQRYYLRDLPIHHSQKICGEGDDWQDFEYRMRPTSDLVSYIMSCGQSLRVVEPQSLANEVCEALQAAAGIYQHS